MTPSSSHAKAKSGRTAAVLRRSQAFLPRIPQALSGTPSSGANSSSRKKLHAVIMFTIATLGVFLQLLYQSKNNSPFDDHDIIMTAILVSLCLYAASSIAEYALNLIIIKTISLLSGFLVIVLPLTILVPILGIIAAVIVVLSMVITFIKLYSQISKEMKNLHNVILASLESAWSGLGDSMHRFYQVFSRTSQSSNGDGNDDSAV